MHLRRMNLKLCVVGERGVGKTSLINRYVENHFSQAYKSTLGAYLYPVELEIRRGEQDLVLAKVAIFDLMGEHSIRETFRDAMFYGTHGLLAVCDIARSETVYAITDWIRAVSMVAGDLPLTIAVNKLDLVADTSIGPAETEWLRKQFPSTRIMFTSARNGEGVEGAFMSVAESAVERTMAASRQRTVKRLARQKILALVARKDQIGVSKGELLRTLKELAHNEIIEEVDTLVRLNLLSMDESGPNTFQVRATEQGRKIVMSTLWEELVIDEPV
ncbi:MAG TPA: Rab family GTPase [Thermoplasmata archaeon]|nr:Rab family GTPase [Thermoplasmata archaeon]